MSDIPYAPADFHCGPLNRERERDGEGENSNSGETVTTGDFEGGGMGALLKTGKIFLSRNWRKNTCRASTAWEDPSRGAAVKGYLDF